MLRMYGLVVCRRQPWHCYACSPLRRPLPCCASRRVCRLRLDPVPNLALPASWAQTTDTAAHLLSCPSACLSACVCRRRACSAPSSRPTHPHTPHIHAPCALLRRSAPTRSAGCASRCSRRPPRGSTCSVSAAWWCRRWTREWSAAKLGSGSTTRARHNGAPALKLPPGAALLTTRTRVLPAFTQPGRPLLTTNLTPQFLLTCPPLPPVLAFFHSQKRILMLLLYRFPTVSCHVYLPRCCHLLACLCLC